jgi:hypothetical protein
MACIESLFLFACALFLMKHPPGIVKNVVLSLFWKLQTIFQTVSTFFRDQFGGKEGNLHT